MPRSPSPPDRHAKAWRSFLLFLLLLVSPAGAGAADDDPLAECAARWPAADAVIRTHAPDAGVPARVMWAIAHKESSCNPDAIGAAGETGAWQEMPAEVIPGRPSRASLLAGAPAERMVTQAREAVSLMKRTLMWRDGDLRESLIAWNCGNAVGSACGVYADSILTLAGGQPAARALTAPVVASGTTTGTVTASAGLRLRAEPALTATVIGLMPAGAQLQVTRVSPDWMAVRLHNADGLPLGTGYASAVWIATSVPPVTTPSPVPYGFRLGVHVINDHRAADDAYTAGARSVVWMDGKLGAVQWARAHPDAYVIYRRYVGQARLTADQWVAALEVAADDPVNLIYTAYNESDSIGTSAGEIRERAAVDVGIARRIRAINPRLLFLAGSFAHGNPDVTNPDVCQAMREAYAPHFNAGLFDFDLHNYTYGRRFATHPPSTAPVIDPIWFELRAEQLVTKCGFARRQGFWSTEFGVEAGAGGYAWAGYNEQQIYEHLRWGIGAAEQSGLYRSWNIFQWGGHAGWRGYDIRGISSGYSRAVRDGGSLSRSVVRYDTPPANYVPARKEMTR